MNEERVNTRSLVIAGACFMLCVVLATTMASESLAYMVGQWESEEYNHSFLIPLIAILLLLQKVPALNARPVETSWFGVGALCVTLVMLVVGELSALYSIVQYAYVGIIGSIFLTLLGMRGFKLIWIPLCYLLFMVPIPGFLLNNLSQSLQLISSEIGVFVIRLFDISVYLEGNVIDLGTYQLQVVEACSGLRYLFPLSSFGFLVAYLFQAPIWQRAVLFISTGPITVLMNSFRIGVIGVLVENWGIGQAEGFLHYFEGWVIFVACLALLVSEIWLFHKLSGVAGSMWDRLDLSFDSKTISALSFVRSEKFSPLIAAIVILGVSVVALQMVEERDEVHPKRSAFVQFPLIHQDWIGRQGYIENNVLDTLKLTDYVMSDYKHPQFDLPVNFYVAYYESQRKGASIHSPRSCIPGGGWEIESLATKNVGSSSGGLELVNRVLIRKGDNRQLVYYWFQQRNRVLTNEYVVKWYLFWDSLTKSRTDGALVRLVVPIPDGYSIEEAELQLNQFLWDFEPLLPRYIPN